MTDITLTDLTSLANDTSAVNSINNNFQTVEDVVNDEVVHTTGGNNVMSQDLDMNSNDLLNVNSGAFTTLTLNGVAVTTEVADASVAKIDESNAWSVSQVGSTQVASITGATTLDFSTNQNFILTLTGNVTLSNPTTETIGQAGFLVFKQDATGSRTLTLGTEYKTSGASGITLSTAASSIDVVPYIVSASGEILLGNVSSDFS